MTETTIEATAAGSSSEGPAVRICTRCKTNARPSNSSWCRQCRNAQAAEYLLKARKRPTYEERTCALEGCEETYTWSSMHAKQRCCSKSHYSKLRWQEDHPRKPEEVLAAGIKRCSKCQIVKSELDFSPSLRAKKTTQCRECFAVYERKWGKQNRHRRSAATRKSRGARLLRSYGAPTFDIDELVEQQGGVCYLCGGQPGLKGFQIDHDHELHLQGLPSYRGLACTPCNTSIGSFDDDPDKIMWVAVALERKKVEMRALQR